MMLRFEQKYGELVLAFIGKFISTDTPLQLSWLEAEVVRFARRIIRPVTPLEIAHHLKISDHTNGSCIN
jgi:hypothetical protein